MNQINYQKVLEKLLAQAALQKTPLRLLLHACCAPCSSYVLEYLSDYFEITVLFYNPNMETVDEYRKRAGELLRFIQEKSFKNPVVPRIAGYNPQEYLKQIQGYEDCPEGGGRCGICYRLRMEYTAKLAKEEQFDYFTTTLTISPLKNAQKINEIGKQLEQQYGVPYLYSDFKKKNGYQRSVQLSKEFHLYRQNYCGCAFSKKTTDLQE